ncbi:uncharacterized oxidoreductase MexAM1_META1p0182-like [Oppia nitens]|uniref:uncharacterized oxidoreductase MexAM1_META1p0182-like n=1 Tax=Oppia nitens TaxID=1686743 RepID=UPI0023D99D9D|nr:uncharacterized oxidoreductase MexAM1_META1p0182-like [Oppia nitens]
MSSIAYNFSNKIALVTGSSSGIGAETCRQLAKSGARVVVTGRSAEKISEVATDCRRLLPPVSLPITKSASDSRVLELVADLTRDSDRRRLVAETVRHFGDQIDILVNNAGFAQTAAITDGSYMTVYRQTMDTHLTASVSLTHLCVPYLRRSSTGGSVVNVSSVRSRQTRPEVSAYCMSKAALDMFTRCMAAELGPFGIRVNSVNPGATRTNLAITAGMTRQQSDEFYDMYASVYPVGRCAEPGDIARAVLYLASDSAAFVTGSNFLVDGGHLAANVSKY